MFNGWNAVLWKLKLTKIRRLGKLRLINKKGIIIRGRLRVLDGVVIDASGDESENIVIGGGLICERSKLLAAGGNIVVGDNVQIGDDCFFTGQGGLQIGNDVLFASRVSLIPNEHCYEDIRKPIIKQPQKSEPIKIGDGCWFGINSTVLSGTTIGKNCVIAAHSVVRGNFPDYCVIGGCPAVIIKKYDFETNEWRRSSDEK